MENEPSSTARTLSSIDVSSPRDRRELIRRKVVDEGYAKIDDLAQAVGVSLMTIHRDLDVLQTEGWLRKVRGESPRLWRGGYLAPVGAGVTISVGG
jgi:predicted ArsR family transcriptional regulator